MKRDQVIRPLILAMLDGAISVGVLTVSGLVSWQVALVAALAGAVSMAIGEFVSVENSSAATDIQLSPSIAAVSSSAGFLAGSAPAVIAVVLGAWWVPIVIAATTLGVLSAGVGWLNGPRFAFRSLILGEIAFGVSVASGWFV